MIIKIFLAYARYKTAIKFNKISITNFNISNVVLQIKKKKTSLKCEIKI